MFTSLVDNLRYRGDSFYFVRIQYKYARLLLPEHLETAIVTGIALLLRVSTVFMFCVIFQCMCVVIDYLLMYKKQHDNRLICVILVVFCNVKVLDL